MINDHHHHDCLFCNNPGVPLPGHILGLRIGKYHFGIFFPVDLFDNNDQSYVATHVKIILTRMKLIDGDKQEDVTLHNYLIKIAD